MKVNKHRRLGKIIQTLERWAPLESSEVSHNLANLFGVDEQEIKRNVVNDLKFLRDEGELIALYYDKFGKLLSKEIEPEDGQFYRLKWQLRSQDGQSISGGQELAQYSSYIVASEDIQQKIIIRQGTGTNQDDWNYFYFDLNNDLYHLAIPKVVFAKSTQVEFALALCRTQGSYPKNIENDFVDFCSKYPNVPCILMSLKEPFLSSYDQEPPVIIEFLKDGSLNISGDANKNSLQFLELPQGKAEDLLKYLSLFRDKTQTTHWSDLKKEDGLEFSEGKGFGLKAPLLLRLKESTGFLIN